MKTALFTLTIFLAIAARKCRKESPEAEALPICIRQKIDSIRAQPRWNPPAQVVAYSFRGQTVYLFSAPCCDQYTTLYSARCEVVCAPSGGLTGKGDRQCPEFAADAREIGIVWKDER